MKKILIALDNSPTAKSVIAAAHAFAPLFGAQLEALHVRVDGLQTVGGAAEAAAIPAHTRGQVVDRVVEAGHDDSVAAVVVGARGLSANDRPLGSTAAAIAAALLKPVLIVPQRAEPARVFRRVLVPLEGTVSTSRAPLGLRARGRGRAGRGGAPCPRQALPPGLHRPAPARTGVVGAGVPASLLPVGRQNRPAGDAAGEAIGARRARRRRARLRRDRTRMDAEPVRRPRAGRAGDARARDPAGAARACAGGFS